MCVSTAKRLGLIGSLAVALLALQGCASTVQDVGRAREAVMRFHDQLNGDKCKEIYDAATPELKNTTKQEEFVALLQAVHRKLGNVKDSTQTRFFVNWTTSGTRVVADYSTKFDGAEATEQFTWRLDGDGARLVSYSINSNALIVK